MIQDNSFIQPIRLQVNDTGWLPAFIVMVHGGAIGMLLLSALPVAVQWGCCIAVVGHAVCQCYQLLPRLNTRAIRKILLKPDGSWWYADGDAGWRSAQLLADSLIHPSLLVMRLQTAAGTRHAVIVADADNRQQLRRLRVRLRYPR